MAQDVPSYSYILGLTKSRRMRWGMLVARPERKIIHSSVLIGNLKGRENWEDLGLDWMMILKFSLKEWDSRTWID